MRFAFDIPRRRASLIGLDILWREVTDRFVLLAVVLVEAQQYHKR